MAADKKGKENQLDLNNGLGQTLRDRGGILMSAADYTRGKCGKKAPIKGEGDKK